MGGEVAEKSESRENREWDGSVRAADAKMSGWAENVRDELAYIFRRLDTSTKTMTD